MKLKRCISLCLVLCLCLGLLPVTAGARLFDFEESLADDLYVLGLFKGVTQGNEYGQPVDYDLDRAPTRTEALVMLIRTLGVEQEALSGTWKHPFTDVAKWADPYVGYAYEKGLTKGVSATAFGTDNASCVQYVTFMLRALGYDDAAGDFKWDDPYELAWSCQILPGIVDTHNFLRADAVIISYAALAAKLKGSEDALATKLMAAGVFSSGIFLQTYRTNAIAEEASPKVLLAEEIYAKCSPAVFYMEVADAAGKTLGTGSGFFITTDGIAVTNYHVIEGASSAKITTTDDKEYNVKGVWSYNVEKDWAVIQVDGSGFTALKMAEDESVTGGQTVYAIGSPLGLQNSITEGIISNTNRTESGVRYLQTSAAISPGSSGGALINEYGHVVGITSGSYVEGQNLNLALPISAVFGYNTAALRTLSSVASAEGAVQPDQPAQPGGQGSSEKAKLIALIRQWIVQNQNEELVGNPAYVEEGRTQDGDEWEFDMYHTGQNSFYCRFLYYFSQSNQVSTTYLLFTPDKAEFDVHYQYYITNDNYVTGKTAIQPEKWDLTLTFKEYDGPEKNRDYLQRDAADSVDLILWFLNTLMEENSQFFGGVNVTGFGFPRPSDD